MSRMSFIRWSGLTAVLAGILRAIASFVPTSIGGTIHFLYFVIDLLLFLGTISLYCFQRKATGLWGLFGFLLTIVGAGLLIANDIENAVVNLYPVAALLFAVGISILAITSWVAKQLPRWTSTFLIVSTLIGMIGYFMKGFDVLFVISGVIFGIGFTGAGLSIWLR